MLQCRQASHLTAVLRPSGSMKQSAAVLKQMVMADTWTSGSGRSPDRMVISCMHHHSRLHGRTIGGAHRAVTIFKMD